MASAYRALHEGEGFDALLAQWQSRLEKLREGRVELTGDGGAQMAELGALIDRLPPPAGTSGVFHSIANAAGPAMVLTPDLSVVATNEAGRCQFGALLGMRPTFAWLDEDGLAALQLLARTARSGGNRKSAIIRTYIDDTGGLAELFLIKGEKVSKPLLAMRALGVRWSGEIEGPLQEAFGLTTSECQVARLMFELADPSAIAHSRGSTIRTVRTQLSQIFLKTGCSGQVDLVLLLSSMCSRAREQHLQRPSDGAQPAKWRDPLGREATFAGPYGQVAYTWMGRAGGKPGILMHAPFTGYLLPALVQRMLEEANIQLFAPSRPGFGNSDITETVHPVEAGSQIIGAMLDHLGVQSVPLIGLVNGLVPALRFAADYPGRMSGLLGLGSCLPLDTLERLAELPTAQRVLLELSIRAPQTCALLLRLGFRSVRARGPEFMLARLYAASAVDTATAFEAETLAILMASASLLSAQDHRAILRDLSLITYPFGPLLAQPGPPIAMLAGVVDPVFSIERVRDEASRNARFEILEAPHAGQTVAFSHPELVARSISALFDRVR